MKVYVVVEKWCFDYENGNDFELFDSKEKALVYFNTRKEEVKKNLNYDTIEEEEESFCSYESGYYNTNHIDLYIRERNVK